MLFWCRIRIKEGEGLVPGRGWWGGGEALSVTSEQWDLEQEKADVLLGETELAGQAR